MTYYIHILILIHLIRFCHFLGLPIVNEKEDVRIILTPSLLIHYFSLLEFVSSTSLVACLNSFNEEPKAFPISGSLEGPNITNAKITININTGIPIVPKGMKYHSNIIN